jgi:hypothetical protein
VGLAEETWTTKEAQVPSTGMVGKLKEHHYQGLDGRKENHWIGENAETVPGTPAVFKDCPYPGSLQVGRGTKTTSPEGCATS